LSVALVPLGALPSEENLAVVFFEKSSQRLPRFSIRRITRPFDGPVLKTSYACEVSGHNYSLQVTGYLSL
jgi:hypothetical protein